MNQKNETLTPQESLDVITSMISQAKGNIRNSSFYFLLWGWTIVIANLGVFILIKFATVTNPSIIFAITIPSAVISVFHGMRQEKRVTAPTLIVNIYTGISCAWIYAKKI